MVKSAPIEMLSRRSIAIKDYNADDEGNDSDSDKVSLKMDLSMGEQFYYEIISSFEQEEVFDIKFFFFKWSLIISCKKR